MPWTLPFAGGETAFLDSMALRAAILWVHVLCGVVWVGASASFALAAAALTTESEEWRDFALKAAPTVNRVNLVVAAIIPLTGIGNLVFAAMARRYVFPPEFVGILAVKIALYVTMVLVLVWAWRAEAAMRQGWERNDSVAAANKIRRLTRLYGFTVALGVVALALGLWLSGVN
ncbi:MAG: hypothetical protein ACREH9_11445 [Pseudomonadota bacterium]